MKNIIAIFKRDLRRLLASPVAMIIMVGLIIIPSLYAWFNIAANWDPYSNTGHIAIAVSNEDAGTTVAGATINAGEKVVGELKANDAMDWTFVDRDEALEGVRSGEFYAAVIIPKEFSKDMTSILSGSIEKPVLEYYLNEKTNAIANKMTNVGVDTVQTKVNQAFVETVTLVAGQLMNVSANAINQSDPIDTLVKNMEEVSTSISDFKVTIAAIKNASASARSMLGAAQNLLPGAQQLLTDGQVLSSDSRGLIDSGRTLSARMNASMVSILEILHQTSTATTKALRNLASQTGADSQTVATQLETLADNSGNIIEICNKTIGVLTSLENVIPSQKDTIESTIATLREIIADQQKLATDLNTAAGQIRQSGQISQETLGGLADENAAVDTKLSELTTTYQTQIAPALDTAAGDVYDSLGDLSSFLSTASGSISGINDALGSMGSALDSGNLAMDNVIVILDRTQGKITDIVNNLKSVKSDSRWGQLMNIMRIDPETGASFIASPVNLKTTSFYPVANYGAAMTPFYTTLCLWVGGLVLVALIKTDVKHPEDFENLQPWQIFFGRYLIFLVAALLQGLVACLGDIFILRVEMVSPALFIVIGLWTSVVYSFFIYTLTAAFDEVGKAIAVLIMVIQVAGSGGTFPIQVLPGFFQALNPYMAFTYSIGAMREAVAGLYDHYFLHDMLALLGYVGVSLLIGLVLHKPLLRLNAFFKRKLEDTGLFG